MATGLIGTSTVAFNTGHNNTGGGGVRITVDGTTLSYTCPASGVRYAVVNIVAALSVVGPLPAAGASGADPYVYAGILKSSKTVEGLRHSYSVILAPGQTWTGKASSTVFIASNTNFGADTFAEITASALEVV